MGTRPPSLEYAEDFTWQPFRIKPLAVWAMRMNQDFECTTLQGTLYGKAGDWMVRGDDGWTHPVVDEIFRHLYVKREWRKPNEVQEDEAAKKVHAADSQGA